MKRLLLLATVAFFGALNLNAQCTPDPQYTSPGIYPDSATNFTAGCVGQLYSQLITNVVPEDTTVTVPVVGSITANIDSINLVSVTGLPAGLAITCSPARCSYPGGSIGCAVISGTPTTAGTYALTINLTAYVQFIGAQNFTLDYYKIVVGSNCTATIEENSTSVFKLFPNPASSKVTVQGLDNETVKGISLTNAEGKIIRSYNMIEGSSMDINMEGLNSGLYFVSINHKSGTEVLKLIKE